MSSESFSAKKPMASSFAPLAEMFEQAVAGRVDALRQSGEIMDRETMVDIEHERDLVISHAEMLGTQMQELLNSVRSYAAKSAFTFPAADVYTATADDATQIIQQIEQTASGTEEEKREAIANALTVIVRRVLTELSVKTTVSPSTDEV